MEKKIKSISKISPNKTKAVTEVLDVATLKRLEILCSALGDIKQKDSVSESYKATQGDWKLTIAKLKKMKIKTSLLKKIDFIHSLAEVTNDNQDLVTALKDLPGISSLRDLALAHSTKSLADILEGKLSSKEDSRLSADDIMQNVFFKETSAVLQRMARAGELPLDEKGLSKMIATFFANQPDFDIRTTSIHIALKHPKAFNRIEDKEQEEVTIQLKPLQRVASISPTPDTLKTLLHTGLTSAHEIAEIPEEEFVKQMEDDLGEVHACMIHRHAACIKKRNEQTLRNLSELVKGIGIESTGGKNDLYSHLNNIQKLSKRKELLINCENLFLHSQCRC